MKRWALRSLAAAAMAAALLSPTAAGAAPPTGRDFGQHVAACAQAMGGFDGIHNPGMHHGFAGWDGMECEH